MSGGVRLPGSAHRALRGATAVRPSDPDAAVEVALLLRRARELPAPQEPALLPHERRHITRAAHAASHGADAGDVAALSRWAESAGLALVAAPEPGTRSALVSGPAGRMAEAFGVALEEHAHAGGSYRHAIGDVHVPAEIAPFVTGVLGLSTRPVARPRTAASLGDAPRAIFTIPELGHRYDFPEGDATGVTVGVVELGGGHHPADLEALFRELGMAPPSVTVVPVAGAHPRPAPVHDLQALVRGLTTGRDPGLAGAALARASWSYETTMDLELLGGLAPGARLVVYSTTNDERGMAAALEKAIADRSEAPTLLSLSWSEAEPELSAHFATILDDLLASCAALGITVVASSGDDGSRNGSEDGSPSVNLPASSPHVLACGGTTLAPRAERGASETVWNVTMHGQVGASGGGVSVRFPLPRWQQGAGVPEAAAGHRGRGVPDVAANADPRTAARLVVGGLPAFSSGTSAAAPLWAALLARISASIGHPLGQVNPLLYHLEGKGEALLRDVIHGDNGDFHARKGWDACTGLGSPHGQRLLERLRAR